MNWQIFKHRKDPKPMNSYNFQTGGCVATVWSPVGSGAYCQRVGDSMRVRSPSSTFDAAALPSSEEYHWRFKGLDKIDDSGYLFRFELTPNEPKLTLETLAERVLRLEKATAQAPTYPMPTPPTNEVQYVYWDNNCLPCFGTSGTKTNYKSVEIQVQDKDGYWRPVTHAFKSQTYRIAFHK